MNTREIPIGEFRQRATQLLHEIEETQIPIVVTRHGVPVVEIRPVKETAPCLRGSVRFAPDYDPHAPVVAPEDSESV